MAFHTFVEQEVLAMLEAEGAPAPLVDRLKRRIEMVKRSRPQIQDGESRWIVSSSYGHTSQRGSVIVEVDKIRHQMLPEKAKEIANMLLSAAEASISDEVVMKLLRKVGITDPQRLGAILLDLRELRQGSRDVVYPS